jgi:hypothetical protein
MARVVPEPIAFEKGPQPFNRATRIHQLDAKYLPSRKVSC